MADLDSFFAKKDKKKFKGKKFTNPDDIAKRLEEKEKKLEENLSKTETKKPLNEVLESVVSDKIETPVDKKEEEEEWQDFKDPDVDLENLKLSKLQIENDDDGFGDGSSDDPIGNGVKENSDSGVWGKAIETAPERPRPVVVETPKPAPQPAQTKSSYVPPHLRNAQPSSTPKITPGRKSKQAPDITSDMAFPTLGNATTPMQHAPWNRNKSKNDRYEEVKHGAAAMRPPEHSGPKLNMMNRFNALSDRS